MTIFGKIYCKYDIYIDNGKNKDENYRRGKVKKKTIDEINKEYKEIFEDEEIYNLSHWIEPNEDVFSEEDFLENAEKNKDNAVELFEAAMKSIVVSK